jgi:regulator of RNase E activity RraB
VPAPWTQAFNVYFFTRNGVPFFRNVDLAAIEHVPLGSHPRYLGLRVRMLDPREDGLRSEAETDALYELQDQLERGLGDAYDAIYWGKTVGEGWTIFHFNVPPEPSIRGIPVPDPPAVADYPYQLHLAEDPDWTRYRDAYPNAFHENQIWNRTQQEELLEQGDRLAKRRRIDHTALFPSEETTDQARRALRRAGFRVGPTFRTDVPDDDKRFGLEFRRADRCDGTRPDEITAEILDCIEPCGGYYNGWGTFVKPHRGRSKPRLVSDL